MEKFSLKWNEFQASVTKSFGILRRERNLFDVTLVSDTEEHIPAHRLVLSACSDFFKNIFKKVDQQNPLIYLAGVSSGDILMLLEYIYHGEVQIFQEELSHFWRSLKNSKLMALLVQIKKILSMKTALWVIMMSHLKKQSLFRKIQRYILRKTHQDSKKKLLSHLIMQRGKKPKELLMNWFTGKEICGFVSLAINQQSNRVKSESMLRYTLRDWPYLVLYVVILSGQDKD